MSGAETVHVAFAIVQEGKKARNSDLTYFSGRVFRPRTARIMRDRIEGATRSTIETAIN